MKTKSLTLVHNESESQPIQSDFDTSLSPSKIPTAITDKPILLEMKSLQIEDLDLLKQSDKI